MVTSAPPLPAPPRQDKEEQWMTKLVPGAQDSALLQPLRWNTRYEVEITARNVKGLSEPTFYQFFMPQEPHITGTSRVALISLLTTSAQLCVSVCIRDKKRRF